MKKVFKQYRKQQGFTILELLIAMTVFSLVLTGATSAMVQISRMYFKAVTSARTQTISRLVLDDISRPLQFSGEQPRIGDPKVYGGGTAGEATGGAICVGANRYTFVVDAQVEDDVPAGTYDHANRRIRHALWRDVMTNPTLPCQTLDLTQAVPDQGRSDSVTEEGQELLGQHMRLSRFGVCPGTEEEAAACPGVDPNTFQVAVGVLYGDEDLLETLPDGRKICQGGIVTAHFCALSELSTVVTRRLH